MDVLEIAYGRYLDDHQDLYVERLAKAVAIQSVSALASKRPDTIRMVKETAKVSFVHQKVIWLVVVSFKDRQL